MTWLERWAVIERMAARWPDAEPVQIYGMTESGPSGSRLEPADLARKPASIGTAMPHCEILIVDDDLAALPPGQTGEILLRGPGLARGYFRNDEATAEAFQAGGIRTGDIGHLDEEDFLYFTDRKKDVINRGGLKISSIAVEDVLHRGEGVKEAAVIAVPHPHLGEDIAACLVPLERREIDVDLLKLLCKRTLADYERPRHWIVLDKLPRNPMGKVLKSELRDIVGRRLKP